MPRATTGHPHAEISESSFAHHVGTLSKRAGRGKRPVYGAEERAYVDFGADDPRHDLFERVFRGLYEADGLERGAVRFFDVGDAPPRSGRPTNAMTLSFDELVGEIRLRSTVATA